MFSQLGQRQEGQSCGPAVAAALCLVICHTVANTCLPCHLASLQNTNPLHHHHPIPSPLHLLSNLRAIPLHLTAQQPDPLDLNDVAVGSDPQFVLLHSPLCHLSFHSLLLSMAKPPSLFWWNPLSSPVSVLCTCLCCCQSRVFLCVCARRGGGCSTLTAPAQACELSASFCVARLRL